MKSAVGGVGFVVVLLLAGCQASTKDTATRPLAPAQPQQTQAAGSAAPAPASASAPTAPAPARAKATPVAKPVAKPPPPAVQPRTATVAKPVHQPVAKPVSKPVAKPVVKATQKAAPAPAAHTFANCTDMHGTYPHGVGRAGAQDHVSGSSRPVTSFAVNTAIYQANSGSDRDHDGIACEKL